MTWHLILAILASFLPPLLFLTHLRGWWLTLWLVTDIWWHCAPGDHFWYLSTCSTAASPQFLSTRASARASSKSSASNSAGPACQQLLQHLRFWPRVVHMIYMSSYAPTYPNGAVWVCAGSLSGFDPSVQCNICNSYPQWTFIHIHTCHPADSKVPYMPSIHAILCPTGVSHGDESMEGGTWCGMPQDSQDPTQLRPCDRLLRKWWSWHIVTISIYHGSKFAQQSGL